MRLLLGSGGFRTAERREVLGEAMRRHFDDAGRILFLPYAVADWDGYVQRMNERDLSAGYEIVGVHAFPDPVAAVREAEAVYVGGGNTFRLTAALHELGLLEPIRQRVLDEGIPYMGVSAGSNVACPTMQTTNDMPVVMPASFETLGLIPFQINAHYYPGNVHFRTDAGYHEHYGETRDDRLREFHELNDPPVVGLYEGALLTVHDGTPTLLGGPARVFRRGEPSVDVHPGDDLTGLLG